MYKKKLRLPPLQQSSRKFKARYNTRASDEREIFETIIQSCGKVLKPAPISFGFSSFVYCGNVYLRRHDNGLQNIENNRRVTALRLWKIEETRGGGGPVDVVSDKASFTDPTSNASPSSQIHPSHVVLP